MPRSRRTPSIGCALDAWRFSARPYAPDAWRTDSRMRSCPPDGSAPSSGSRLRLDRALESLPRRERVDPDASETRHIVALENIV
jgi:hypothetical protein